MNKRLSLVILGLVMAGGLSAQQSGQCGTDEQYEKQKATDPTLQQKEDAFNQAAAMRARQVAPRGVKYTIPVVFHIFYNGGSENISRAQCVDAIRALNEDYNRGNADTAGIRAQFKSLVSDVQVEFQIATKDPWGNCTEGITRTETPLTENADNEIKKLISWNPDHYLNIWVVRNIGTTTTGGITLGYAQFPWAGRTFSDGVILRHDMIGTIGTAATTGLGFNKGRVLTHEVGHWLGLLHTFQGGCTDGDFCDDTPPVNGTFVNANCPAAGNSCTNDVPDMLDMWENYMDYSRGTCQALFTPKQVARIHTALTVQRSFLYTSENLAATGITVPGTNCKPKAEFYCASKSICSGKTVQFTNMSYQYSGSPTYQWIFEGGSPETSTATSPTVTYNEPGSKKVTLIATNANGSDTIIHKYYIEVLPANWDLNNKLEEGFETGRIPWDWKVGGNNNAGWEIYNFKNDGGNTSLRIYNYLLTTGNLYTLRTPQVDASGGSATLSFRYAFAQRDNSNGNPTSDRLSLRYSIDCGQNWSTIWTRSASSLNTVPGTPSFTYDFIPPNSTYWATQNQSLTSINALSRRNILFQFEFNSDGGNHFYLDDINLTQIASVHNAGGVLPVSYFPNPASDQIVIQGLEAYVGRANVSITDMAGKEVAVLTGGSQGNGGVVYSLPSSLSNGMYLLKVSANGLSKTMTIVIGR